MMPAMIFRLPLPAFLILGSALTMYSAQQNSTQTVNPGLVAESERALVRSQEDLVKARNLMKRAETLRSEKNLRQSFQLASEALDMAPTGSATLKIRTSIVNSYTAIAIEYARQLINDGVFTDSIAETNGLLDSKGQPLSAESILKSILLPSVNPGNQTAKQMLSDLEQPGVYNKTISPKFAAQRDEVTRLLGEASGFAESGRYDLALSRYESVLTIDPYNTAARKGMEALHNSGMKYADMAYNETRSRMLWQVEKAWERPPRKSKQGRTTESTGRQQDVRGTDQIVEKLNSIVIDKIDLSDSPISEAVEYLKQKSVSLDPNKKGVNIFLKLAQPGVSSPSTQAVAASTTTQQPTPVASAPSTEPHLTLSLNHVPLYVALDYIAKLSNLKLKIDPYAVSIVPLSEPTDVMVTKEYQVPPTFIPPKSLDSSSGLPQPGSAGVPDPNKVRVAQRMDAKDYLVSQGVEFPIGSSANYLAAGSKLVIRNTRDNIDVIDSLVDAAMGVAPSQVDIQTKFLEINQNNFQELGFDWLLGPFSIGGGVYGSGGGNGTNVNGSYYPFGNPMAGGAVMNPVGGIRSGDQSITGNSVDALLAGQVGASAAPAPGIFSIAGVFSEPQFQLVIRALNQKKGIDLMSAPKVTTKSGVKATVKIVNEFIYPRQYQPPQIPQSTSNTGGIPPTVTPSFPTDFTKQDLGVTLDAKPTIGPDGYTIDLELNPRVIDFDGFINYGSPINSVGYIRTAGSAFTVWNPVVQTLTTNTINQPVFSTREVNTFVTVWDGQTVALGGLIREDVQKVQDKVPLLGDVPLAGRLFRSEADQKLKKNLVIFVTPRILDADGQPRRGDAEEPDIVKPLGLPPDLPGPTFSSPAIGGK
ncbi:MAG: type II and III secretion system protein [Proteobacteria bacterium]|nr:type II and III secretion system protein [Pseudomonadota bacterium]